MTKKLITSKGDIIQLGRELGKGGEALIYEVPSRPRQAAKLYHKILDSRKQAKISFMTQSVDERLLGYTAWPQETLHSERNGAISGFLMPKVTGRAPIHMLYSPAHRKQEYPKAAWNFLVFAARNTAAAFSTLHDHGHIFGDVNPGNVMVGGDSLVTLIDCDSFQIAAPHESYLCDVGVSNFCPPELQDLSSYHGVKRTFNHDNFGLALLIFHILFGGRHPFSGVPQRPDVGERMESDIKAFRFAYSRTAQTRGFQPPPNSIPLAILPDDIAIMFELAFTERGASGGRPSAQQWTSALDMLRNRLKACERSSMHVYPNHLTHCPWCDLDQRGVVYFIDLKIVLAGPQSTFALQQTWAAIEAITAPPALPLPRVDYIAVIARPLSPEIPGTAQKVFLRILVVIGAITCVALVPFLFLLILIGAGIAWSAAGSKGEVERNAERSRRQAALEGAKRDYEAIVGRAQREAGAEGFTAKKQELIRMRDEFRELPAIEKREIDKLYATAESRQKQQYLMRCFIDSAGISGVGVTKKAALRSFGIETAADVSWSSVRSVRGFGDVRTRAVVDWRNACERRFVFDSRVAVTESDKNAIRAGIAARKRVLEVGISAGAATLQRFRLEAAGKASALGPALNEAARRLAQAVADRAII